MIAALQEINSVIAHDINHPVLLGEAPRPSARRPMPQWLGQGNPLKGGSEDSLHDGKKTQRHFAIRMDPELEVFNELRMKHWESGDVLGCVELATLTWQGRPSASVHQQWMERASAIRLCEVP